MRNKRKNKYLLLLILLLGITLGYAAISTTLKITGTTNVNKNSWKVYWDEDSIEVTQGSVNGTAAVSDDGTVADAQLTWTADLNLPGDFYEFTIDAVNESSIHAMISSITPTIPANLASYINYSVTYADGIEPAQYHLLAKATKSGNTIIPTREKYKVRVEFDSNATADDLDDIGENGDSYEFGYEVSYAPITNQAFSRPRVALTPQQMAVRLAEIKSNPNKYKNPNQEVFDDIGVDMYGNVVNLDVWTCVFEDDDGSSIDKAYRKNDYDEITLGDYGGYVTMATASSTIVNGEWITPIPAYIWLEEENDFSPVVETNYLFKDFNNNRDRTNLLKKLPKLPYTIKKIGSNSFTDVSFEYVVIPNHIVEIDDSAFSGAFNQNGENNTLTFENNSELEFIGTEAFVANKLKGNLVFPSTLTSIGDSAFEGNNLTSVSIPNGATYDDGTGVHPYPSFDSGTTIIRY